MHSAEGYPAAGAFGALYTGTSLGRDVKHLQYGTPVAIKFTKCSGSAQRGWVDNWNNTEESRALMLEEVFTHRSASSLNHPNIVTLYGAFDECCALSELVNLGCEQPGRRNRLVLVMEKCTGHDLYDVLSLGETLPGVLENLDGEEGVRTRPYNEVDKRGLFKQIAGALRALHAAGIVHRDIKPENIILKAKPAPGVPPTLKLIDFGLAIDLSRGDVRTGRTGVIGTSDYAPPELLVGNVFAGTEAYQPPIDVYSLGVVLFLMLAGFHNEASDFPWVDFNRADSHPVAREKRKLLTFLQRGHPHAVILENHSPMVSFALHKTQASLHHYAPHLTSFPLAPPHTHFTLVQVKELLTRMLDPNPKTRITMEQVLESAWIKASPPEIVASVTGGGDHTPCWLPHRRSMNARLMISLVAGHARGLSKKLSISKGVLSPTSIASIYQDFYGAMLAHIKNDTASPQESATTPLLVSHPCHRIAITRGGFHDVLVKEGVDEQLARHLGERIFSSLDTNGDGVLTWKEFVVILPLLSDAPINELYPESTLRVFWDSWASPAGTAGGERTMCPNHLRDMLTYTHVGEGMEDWISKILDSVDVNHDNVITFQEFMTALKFSEKNSSSTTTDGAGAMAAFRGFSSSPRSF